jgi:hypothetical protein
MAAPPDFVAGSVLTAAQMSAIGLWLIKTQTIGTAVTTTTVTGAFSADYENYRIVVAGGVSSANTGNNNFALTLGSTTAAYYQSAQGATFAAAAAAANVSNGAAWTCGGQSTSSLNMVADIFRPFAADETAIAFSYVSMLTTGYGLTGAGYLNNTTSYTAFTITSLATTTHTGGTVYVYGYRD